MIIIEQACRKRKCHHCSNPIKSGEWHIVYQASGFYSHNICRKCFNKKAKDLEEYVDGEVPTITITFEKVG